MRTLNYQHLLYFWTVARTGSIAAAGRELLLSQPAISTQIKSLEGVLGTALFHRTSRGLALTDKGRTVFDYADRIFRLGQELHQALEPAPAAARLRVGLGQMTPKLLAKRLLAPLFQWGEAPVDCRESSDGALLAALDAQELDLVVVEEEQRFRSPGAVGCELLARVDFGLFGAPSLAAGRGDFPHGLAGAPALLPAPGTPLRERLSAWLGMSGVSLRVVAECEDGALMAELGRQGLGLLLAPLELQADLAERHGLQLLGAAEGVHALVFLGYARGLRRHPAVQALTRLR